MHRDGASIYQAFDYPLAIKKTAVAAALYLIREIQYFVAFRAWLGIESASNVLHHYHKESQQKWQW